METSVSETGTREITLLQLSFSSVVRGWDLKVLLLCHFVPPLFLHLSILEWWEVIPGNKNGDWGNWSRKMKEANARRCSWAQHSCGRLWLNPAGTLWGTMWNTSQNCPLQWWKRAAFPYPLPSPIGEGFPAIANPDTPAHDVQRRARFPEGREPDMLTFMFRALRLLAIYMSLVKWIRKLYYRL